MRNTLNIRALLVLVCFMAAFGAAYVYVQKTAADICKAADRQNPGVESFGGDMLWESLSRQFVYSVMD